jgi:hypothetical protein
VKTCWPTKVPPFDSGSMLPSIRMRWLGSSRRPFEEKEKSVPAPPSISIQPSVRVAPVS